MQPVLLVICGQCGNTRGVGSPPADGYELEELGLILRDAWNGGNKIEFLLKGHPKSCLCDATPETLALLEQAGAKDKCEGK